MVELILSAAGLALSAPGAVIAFTQCGEYIQNLARKFTHAPETVRNIGAFGHDLHQGKLKLDLELAEWAMSLEDIEPILKDTLEDHLIQLRRTLLDATSTLESLFDTKGNVRRTYFMFLGERKALQVLNELRKWQDDFIGVIDLIDKKRRLVPDNLLLSIDKFRVIHKPNGQDYIPLSAGSHLFLASGEYRDGHICEIRVLVERKPMEQDINPDELKDVVSYLAARLNVNSSNRRILQCLGYREEKRFELVFKIPETLNNPQTLQSFIAANTDGIYGGYPLEERFRLCREICEAVLSVHTSNLVHKNIRPDTILLFERMSAACGQISPRGRHLGSPILTEWSMLRKVSGLSSRRGENDWMKDIYRHPHRQGLQPEFRYNIGHDIYSLGVTLLEVGLWKPFIQKERCPEICERFQAMAIILGDIRPEDSNSIRRLTPPPLVQKVMVALAEREMPPRMGSLFARFIVACLTCLEGGMGDARDFENNSNVAAIRFHELVVQAFYNISY